MHAIIVRLKFCNSYMMGCNRFSESCIIIIRVVQNESKQLPYGKNLKSIVENNMIQAQISFNIMQKPDIHG